MKATNTIYHFLMGGLICVLASALTSGISSGRKSTFYAPVRLPAPLPPSQRQTLRTIVIDPGHGGFDTGTEGLEISEKEVALGIGMKLGALINEEFPDIKVVYTRTTDIMPGGGSTIASGLNYRAELANRSRGDLFIAIHCDNDGHPAGLFTVHKIVGHKYIGKGKRRHRVPIYQSYTGHHTRKGTEVFIWKADRSGFKGSAINQRSEEGGAEGTDSTGEAASDSAAFDMNSPEARMRSTLYEKKYFGNSALFATLVGDEFTKAGREDEGVFQRDAGIRVLQATGMPSVLIETGFLSNVEEEQYLKSEEGQNEVARNILSALRRYKATIEGHTPNNPDGTGSGPSKDSSGTPGGAGR
jgi:N-acetylmuramoyl-L-alanine amidase